MVSQRWAWHSEAVSSTSRIGTHFHGNVHTACVCQHKSMTEIAEMMESNLLTFEALAKYQSWMHREDHFNDDSHQSNLDGS